MHEDDVLKNPKARIIHVGQKYTQSRNMHREGIQGDDTCHRDL
jgi:hypothetical protein